jgi:hypothetical protein
VIGGFNPFRNWPNAWIGWLPVSSRVPITRV